MPLSLPNLDDRSYADLVEEARSLIPSFAPEWTNHNPSDPGITLVEMFAHLTEMLVYRLNRVTDENVLAFVALLKGPRWKEERAAAENPPPLRQELREAVLELRRPWRAVTCEDFERLTLEAAPGRLARARCAPRRNLDSENPAAPDVDKPGHVSVIVVPRAEGASPRPDAELLAAVREYLEPRRLLTTSLHVVGPRYRAVGVQLTLTLKPDADEARSRSDAADALRRYLHPLTGGPDGRGWPFGRDVHVSEIFALLDALPAVDYVTATPGAKAGQRLDVLVADAARLVRNEAGEVVAVAVGADELVDARVDASKIIVRRSPAALR
jgi:hypothetical protein